MIPSINKHWSVTHVIDSPKIYFSELPGTIHAQYRRRLFSLSRSGDTLTPRYAGHSRVVLVGLDLERQNNLLSVRYAKARTSLLIIASSNALTGWSASGVLGDGEARRGHPRGTIPPAQRHPLGPASTISASTRRLEECWPACEKSNPRYGEVTMTMFLLSAWLSSSTIESRVCLLSGNSREVLLLKTSPSDYSYELPVGERVYDYSLLSPSGVVGVVTVRRQRTNRTLYLVDMKRKLARVCALPDVLAPIGLTGNRGVNFVQWVSGKWRVLTIDPSNGSITSRTRPGALSSILAGRWWPDLDHLNIHFTDSDALELLAPFVRRTWAAEGGRRRIDCENHVVELNGKKIYDFGPGARITTISGNNRLAIVSVVYFENKTLRTFTGRREQWTDSFQEPMTSREVYCSAIFDMKSGACLELIDGAARVEVVR